jgi:hypothetical protein
VIIEKIEDGPSRVSYWLDPARDYLVLREHQSYLGVDSLRMDISYRHDTSVGWVPSGWMETRLNQGGGVLAHRFTAVVNDYSVNQPIPWSAFMTYDKKDVSTVDFGVNNQTKSRLTQPSGTATREPRSSKTKPFYDPFADATADVAAALKQAKDRHKRVLIEFGANWCPGCLELSALLKENPEISAAWKKDFVLALVDYDAARKVYEKYVSPDQQNGIPRLVVLDSNGSVLKSDDTSSLEQSNEIDPGKVKAFLAEWSPAK